jgi:HEAT repeat protein
LTGIEVLVVAAGAALAGIIGRLSWVASRMPWSPEPLPWSWAAEACHLTPLSRTTWIAGPNAPARDLRVRFEMWREGEDPNRRTRISVNALDRGIVSLSLSPETRATAQAKQRGAREIETGDEGFDDEFYVTGPSAAVRAVLNHETRVLLRSLLVEVDLEVVAGELRGLIREESDPRERYELLLSRTLPLLLDAARRLRRPADTASQLAHNATTDREPGVRRENLLALVREYPDDPVTRETIRAACGDPSDDVRVRAASALGDEGRPTLLEVARREDSDDVAAGRAVAALGDHLTIEVAKEILGRALRSRRTETAHECLASLGRRADATVVPLIAKVLAIENGELAATAARALAETGLPAAEAPLLAALERDTPAIRVAAAEALGRVGSAAAVLPLKEIETQYRDDATRRAARQAVASIQSRLPGASPGQLSLASADAGAVSLAEDETGRLSLDRDRER